MRDAKERAFASIPPNETGSSALRRDTAHLSDGLSIPTYAAQFEQSRAANTWTDEVGPPVVSQVRMKA